MKKMIFSLHPNIQFANTFSKELNAELGLVEMRHFPDDEIYIRVHSDVKNKLIIIVYSLDHPNNKILPLFFLSKTLKELGAKKIYLVAPYLPYMRQDKQFNSGEAVTSIYFAMLLSSFIDRLITIDPHLHRIKNLSEIYTIPTTTLHAITPIAEWIKTHIKSPLIIGPDEESTQWVSEIAAQANSPFVIANKIRHSDANVTITLPDINSKNGTPVLVDDIISTGTSMCAVIQQLLLNQFNQPICIGIHALFDYETQKKIMSYGAHQIVTCNTITHPSNAIDITYLLLEGIKSD